LLLLLYHYMFRPPRAILRRVQYITLSIYIALLVYWPSDSYVYITQQDAPHRDKDYLFLKKLSALNVHLLIAFVGKTVKI
jgi:hypothetical protein